MSTVDPAAVRPRPQDVVFTARVDLANGGEVTAEIRLPAEAQYDDQLELTETVQHAAVNMARDARLAPRADMPF